MSTISITISDEMMLDSSPLRAMHDIFEHSTSNYHLSVPSIEQRISRKRSLTENDLSQAISDQNRERERSSSPVKQDFEASVTERTERKSSRGLFFWLLRIALLYYGYYLVKALALKSVCVLPVAGRSSICQTQFKEPPDIIGLFERQMELAYVQEEMGRYVGLPAKIRDGESKLRESVAFRLDSSLEASQQTMANLTSLTEISSPTMLKLQRYHNDVERFIDVVFDLNVWAERWLADRDNVYGIYIDYIGELEEDLEAIMHTGREVANGLGEMEARVAGLERFMREGVEGEERRIGDDEEVFGTGFASSGGFWKRTWWSYAYGGREKGSEIKTIDQDIMGLDALSHDIAQARLWIGRVDERFLRVWEEVGPFKNALRDSSIRWNDDDAALGAYLAAIRGVVEILERGKKQTVSVQGGVGL